jgi:hypothetical protein
MRVARFYLPTETMHQYQEMRDEVEHFAMRFGLTRIVTDLVQCISYDGANRTSEKSVLIEVETNDIEELRARLGSVPMQTFYVYGNDDEDWRRE